MSVGLMFQHQRENRALGFPGVQQLSWLQALLKSRNVCVRTFLYEYLQKQPPAGTEDK